MPEQKRTAEHPTQKEKVEALTGQLENGIKEFLQSGKFQEYLKTMSKFHSYSFRNCMLIAMQNPAATLVAGFQAWKNKFGRTVNRGEKGMQILAPIPYDKKEWKQKLDSDGEPLYNENGEKQMEEVTEKHMSFRVVTVFDVAQTSGKPLPTLETELDGSVEQYALLLESLKASIDAPITIEPFDETESAKGYYTRSDHSIHVREGMSEAQTVKTAIHEAAHSILHNDNESAIEKTRETRECEAESVAYIVCNHFGIDTSDYSFPYLASWASDTELPELQASLATIQQTANDLISKLSAKMQELQKTDVQEASATDEKVVLPVAQSSEAPILEIPDKTFVIVKKSDIDALIPKLEEKGIAYHTTANDKTDTVVVTISKSNMAAVQALAGMEKKPIGEKPKEEPQKIGNTPYHQIEDKSFVKISDAAIASVVQALNASGIKYSGLIDPVKGNVITVSKADKPYVIQLQQDATEKKDNIADTAVAYRFKSVSAEEMKAVQAAEIPIVAAKQKGDDFIIKIAATDAKRIDAVLTNGSAATKKR